jgi:PGF-CTERM protein
VTVFLGEEEVDVGPAVGSSSVTFSGIAGDADGDTIVADDTSAVDFTENNGFSTGGYDTSGDDNVDFSVREPAVNGLTIETTGGTDVTGGSVSTNTNTLVVSPEFNYDVADDPEITVEDGDGLDVTREVLSSSSVINSEANADGTFTFTYTGSTGGTFDLDVSGLDRGNYTVIFDGLGDARESEFTIEDRDTSISFDDSDVIKGQSTIATVTGEPGDRPTIRVDLSDLDDGATALDVFDNTGDVADGTRNDVGGFATAEVILGDDGEADVRVQTANVDTGSVTFEVIEDGDPVAGDNVADSADLSIGEASISISNAPDEVAVGQEFEVTGVSDEADEVYAYVRLDDEWFLIPGSTNPDTDLDDGQFELDLTAGDELQIPGSYRIGFVADPDFSGIPTAPSSVSNEDWGEFETSTSTSIQTTEGNLDARLSRDVVAADTTDEVVLSGNATGQTDVVAYFVGPRGTVTLEGLSLDDESFEEEISGIFDNRGVHQVIVVSDGRDGDFDIDSVASPSALETDLNSESNTQAQAVDIILDEHQGAGADDNIVRLSLAAERPNVEVDVGDSLAQDTVEITGTSNREPETVIFVSLNDQNGNTVASGEGEVTENLTYSVELDLSDIETGTYRLVVEDDETSASRQIEVTEPASASVSISDQTSDGTTVTVDSVTMSQGGFVTIHDGSLLDGATFDSVRGTSDYLEPGESTDVEVTLDTPYESSGTAIAMPHLDTNGNEEYDFVSSNGAEDAPYTNSAGEIVTDSASLTVETDDTPTATPEPTDTPTATATPEPTDTPTATEEPEATPTPSGGQPGFGFAVAIVALVGAALLALRREN